MVLSVLSVRSRNLAGEKLLPSGAERQHKIPRLEPKRIKQRGIASREIAIDAIKPR